MITNPSDEFAESSKIRKTVSGSKKQFFDTDANIHPTLHHLVEKKRQYYYPNSILVI